MDAKFRRTRHDPELVSAIARLERAGMTVSQVASQLKVSKGTVSGIRTRLGMTKPERNPAIPTPRTPITPLP